MEANNKGGNHKMRARDTPPLGYTLISIEINKILRQKSKKYGLLPLYMLIMIENK
jgi:hypothetical protein